MVWKQNKVNEIIIQEVILLNPINFSYIQTIFFFFKIKFSAIGSISNFWCIKSSNIKFYDLEDFLIKGFLLGGWISNSKSDWS